jgi:hypothetical protein
LGTVDIPLTDTSPLCRTVEWTRTPGGERVIAMLKHRLVVDCLDAATGLWHRLKLRNVLVVDNLPVPLHISSKAILSDLKDANDKEIIKSMSENGAEFKALQFPEQYRKHPYWTKYHSPFFEGIRIFENAAYTEIPRLVREGATGRPNAIETMDHCAQCDRPDPPLLCAQCETVSYCDKHCQRLHWKDEHKLHCQVFATGPPSSDDNHVLVVDPEEPATTSSSSYSVCRNCFMPRPRLRCTQCQSVAYCDRDCQRAHWSEHKRACRQVVSGGDGTSH